MTAGNVAVFGAGEGVVAAAGQARGDSAVGAASAELGAVTPV
jgi:hypothetical protein